MADRRAWTPAEDAVLRDRRSRGWTYAEIGAELNRYPASCQQRARRLGLPLATPRRMAPVPRPAPPSTPPPPSGLTRGSVPPTRLHEWREMRTEPVTRAEWRQRIVEGARRRREATA